MLLPVEVNISGGAPISEPTFREILQSQYHMRLSSATHKDSSSKVEPPTMQSIQSEYTDRSDAALRRLCDQYNLKYDSYQPYSSNGLQNQKNQLYHQGID